MKAGQIKYHLYKTYLQDYKNCDNSLIADELKVCGGRAIADMAVINGRMHGFEIKSDFDSFQRLENQIINYDAVFDTITLVVGKKLNKRAAKHVPRHWGILCIYNHCDEVKFDLIRAPKENKRIKAFNVSQFLWKEEAINLLVKYQIEGNHKNMRKWLLWELLSKHLEIDTLKTEVRDILRQREDWKTHSAFS